MVKKGLIQDTIFLSLSDYGIFIDIVSSACVKNEIYWYFIVFVFERLLRGFNIYIYRVRVNAYGMS